MSSLLQILVPVSIGVVFIVLCIGVFAMFRGGEFNRSWSNKLMRLRVLAQFFAVILIMLAVYAAGS
ncbi:MAG TPA: twin transmembrane helix small protein [Alphaproteobacteria bacterium]|jgi:uncharacterized membrane protein|nr:twin transmembrane helix small protein [Alphaproteobacteria bacterium]